MIWRGGCLRLWRREDGREEGRDGKLVDSTSLTAYRVNKIHIIIENGSRVRQCKIMKERSEVCRKRCLPSIPFHQVLYSPILDIHKTLAKIDSIIRYYYYY